MLQLTDHAATRAQQRGISRDTICLITELADRRIRVPGGAHALSISDRARERWIHGGISPAEMDRTARVVLIADLKAGTIITCEHSHGAKRRFRR